MPGESRGRGAWGAAVHGAQSRTRRTRPGGGGSGTRPHAHLCARSPAPAPVQAARSVEPIRTPVSALPQRPPPSRQARSVQQGSMCKLCFLIWRNVSPSQVESALHWAVLGPATSFGAGLRSCWPLTGQGGSVPPRPLPAACLPDPRPARWPRGHPACASVARISGAKAEGLRLTGHAPHSPGH